MSDATRRLNFERVAPAGAPVEPGPPAMLIDQISERHGFSSREPGERIYRNERAKESATALSIRLPMSVANRFIAYCKAERLTYPEALTRFMEEKGI